MTNEISVFGGTIRLVASSTFPAGITVTQFTDDIDAWDIPEVIIAECTMGPNGDMLTWGKANIIPIKIGIIPFSDDDVNLSILLNANRPQQGKLPVKDNITMTFSYPDGNFVTFINGKIVSGMPKPGAASSGRLKSNSYGFNFQGVA